MFSSVQFSRSVVSSCLRPHESQHARPPCPSPTPGVHSDSTSTESVMPSSHLILCRPLLLQSLIPGTPPPLFSLFNFYGGSVVKNPPTNAGDTGDTSLIPGSGRFPWGKKWLPTPVFLPGKSHGQRSRAGYSSQGHKSQTRLSNYTTNGTGSRW